MLGLAGGVIVLALAARAIVFAQSRELSAQSRELSAHDFNNLITVLLGDVEMLAAKLSGPKEPDGWNG
jgi:hypothetical protein